MKENEIQPEKELFWLSVLVQVLGAGILFGILCTFVGLPIVVFSGASWFWATLTCLSVSIIGWALILFKSPMFGWWFIYTQPNHRRVLANQIVRDKMTKDLDLRLSVGEIASMREIGSGWRGKWPTEYKVGAPINMKSEIIVGTGKEPLVVYTQKGEDIELLIHWQLTATPLPGKLVTLIRQSEDAITSNLKAEVDQFFIQTIKGMKEEDVFKTIDGPGAKEEDKGKTILKKRFETLFGGDRTVDDRELKIGVSTKELILIDIQRTKSYQEAVQAVAVAHNMAQVMAALRGGLDVETAKDLAPDVLLMLTAAIAGRIQGLNPIMVTGLGKNVDPNILPTLLAQTAKSKGK
ncbi:MAG: hypothetical protein WCG02_04230 [Candidatus Taylorbacteria bacterium]